MSFLDDTKEFSLDYVFIKFAGLKAPALIPWIEVAAGKFVPEESTIDELVFLTKPPAKEDADPDVITESSADEGLTKSHLKKADLIKYLDAKLREPANPDVVDYGPVEDIRIQPAGMDLTREVFAFLAQYGAV